MDCRSIVLRRSPYGGVDASEAIRHALGGVIEDMRVTLILVDGGVNAGRKAQTTADTEYASIAEGMKDCIVFLQHVDFPYEQVHYCSDWFKQRSHWVKWE